MRIAKFSLLATGVLSGIQGVFSQSPKGNGAQVKPDGQISLGGYANVSVALGDIKETSLLLCQTSQTPGSPIDETNAFKITELAKLCGPGGSCPSPFTSSDPNVVNTVSFKIDGTDPSGLNNFFFCLTLGDNTCQVYSEVFNIADVGQDGVASSTASFPSLSTPITLQSPPSGASISLAPTGTVGSKSVMTPSPTTLPSDSSISTTGPIMTTSLTTKSMPPTGTTTVPAASGTSDSDSASSPSSSSSSKGGLSAGAKAGIALGAAGFVIILLLLALFCLRRRHAKRSASRSDQLMLTRSGLNDSRDLVTEKESSTGSPLRDNNDMDSGPPVLPVLPVARHSALSNYETIPSQPYSGTAASVPRSKTNSADSDTLGRVISPRSEITIEEPARASINGPQRQSFLGYHGIPSFPTPGGFMGSFVNEDTHNHVPSEEEARRFEELRREEEEERRIDAAIAEAEGRGPLR